MNARGVADVQGVMTCGGLRLLLPAMMWLASSAALAEPAPPALDQASLGEVPRPLQYFGSRRRPWQPARIERDGRVLAVDPQTAAGLDLAVAGSPRGVALATAAQRDFKISDRLLTVGGVLMVASAVQLVLGVALISANLGAARVQDGVFWGSMGSCVAGAVPWAISIPFSSAGLNEQLDAIRAYNDDLAQGRLVPRGGAAR
jgi:hypothetical protein